MEAGINNLLDLAKDLEKVLDPRQNELIQSVTREATKEDLPLYMVGGFVRDLILKHEPADFDLVVEGDAITLGKSIMHKFGGRIVVHPRFMTVQWYPPAKLSRGKNYSIDLVSTRKETYLHPASLPFVLPGTFKEDLNRRDFTINTLAIRLDGFWYGTLVDELGGLEDLRRGIIRVLHPRSFIDDPTRLFRGVRYSQRYGFEFSKETRSIIPSSLSSIQHLSAERIRHEVDLIMGEEGAGGMLDMLGNMKILSQVHSKLGWNTEIQHRFEKRVSFPTSERIPAGWILWLIHLSQHEIQEIDLRLHFKAQQRKEILEAAFLWANERVLINKKSSECTAFLKEYSARSIQCVEKVSSNKILKEILHNYLEVWRKVRSKTSGKTLIQLGLPPGPTYQLILDKLRDGWIDGTVTSVEEEKKLLTHLLKEISWGK